MLLWYSESFFSFDFCFSWWQRRMTSSSCWTNAIACSATGSSPESSTICNTINTYPRTTRDEGFLLFRIFQILDYLPMERLRMEGKEHQAKLCLGSNRYQRINVHDSLCSFGGQLRWLKDSATDKGNGQIRDMLSWALARHHALEEENKCLGTIFGGTMVFIILYCRSII